MTPYLEAFDGVLRRGVDEGLIRPDLDIDWVRRMITRLVAIIPAIVVIGLRGDNSVNDLLIVSQVVLGIQLPFAMIPLMHFTSSRRRMGKYVNGWFLKTAGWTAVLLITALDIYGLVAMAMEALAH